MRQIWTRFWRSLAYRRGTSSERRMTEIRFAVGRAVRRLRKSARMSQEEVATRMKCARATISGIEQGRTRVAIEHAIRALLVLGATDEQIGEAFNAGKDMQVQALRKRYDMPFTQPRPEPWESAPPTPPK